MSQRDWTWLTVSTGLKIHKHRYVHSYICTYYQNIHIDLLRTVDVFAINWTVIGVIELCLYCWGFTHDNTSTIITLGNLNNSLGLVKTSKSANKIVVITHNRSYWNNNFSQVPCCSFFFMLISPLCETYITF